MKYNLIKVEKEIDMKSFVIKKKDYAFNCGEEQSNKNIVKYHIYRQLNELKPDKIKNKKLFLNKYCNIFHLNKINDSLKEEEDKLRMMKSNYELLKKEWSDKYTFLNFEFEVENKMVIGLGDASVYETSITLHHIYGVPYIPGQAIKGKIRNFILQKDYEESEEKALQCEAFQELFGSGDDKKQQGDIIFFDAYPKNNFEIEEDVITPHYGKYYNEKTELPTGDKDLNPINFLVVKDVVFEVVLAIKKDIKLWSIKDIQKKIIETFNFTGIGAKESSGYGYFHINVIDCNKELEMKNKQIQMQKDFDALSKVDKIVYLLEEEIEKKLNNFINGNDIMPFGKAAGLNIVQENLKYNMLNDNEKLIVLKKIKMIMKEKNIWSSFVNKKAIKRVDRIKKLIQELERS